MTRPSPWGVYVHVPWCRIRCPYCAFHVDPDTRATPWAAFVDRALARVAAWRERFEGDPATVYLGGGTPSRLPPAALARLLGGLVTPATVEVTVEANPEDVDAGWLDAAVAAGVDRVSLGVQTLTEAHARRLGRTHTPAEARVAMDLLDRSGLRSWSADLMFALPGQDRDAVARDVDALLGFAPPHVSLYGLTLEPGTPFARAADQGRLVPPDDDAWRAMLDTLVERLEAAGLARYEISNFARPGHRSVHNAGYWEGRPYLGVGPSAHGLAPDGTRWVERADTVAWLDGAPPEVEHPSPRDAAVDTLVSGLRALDGLRLDRLHAHGHVPAPDVVQRLVRGGVLRIVDDRMTLTSDGLYVADAVTAALAEALTPVDPPPRRG